MQPGVSVPERNRRRDWQRPSGFRQQRQRPGRLPPCRKDLRRKLDSWGVVRQMGHLISPCLVTCVLLPIQILSHPQQLSDGYCKLQKNTAIWSFLAHYFYLITCLHQLWRLKITFLPKDSNRLDSRNQQKSLPEVTSSSAFPFPAFEGDISADVSSELFRLLFCGSRLSWFCPPGPWLSGWTNFKAMIRSSNT